MPSALIVEDEPEANRLLARLVQLRGYRVESAFTGAEALGAVERDRFDVIFLDLMLPDASGFAICETLKADRRTHDIPVVMVTARLAAENRLQSLRQGAAEFVPKPYTPDQIFTALTLARSWREGLENLPDQGAIRLDARDEPATYHALGRLWSLLLDRTTLSQEDVQALITELGRWAHELLAWARHSGQPSPATIAYEIGPLALKATIRDTAGWSVPPAPLGLPQIAGAVEFEPSEPDDGGPAWTFEHRFAGR